MSKKIDWEAVINKIKQVFGKKPCKDFNIECPTCRAYMMISWIESYILLLEEESK